MGFFEKVKNMFTEEVEDDVKVEQIKKEVTHVAIESPAAKEEEISDNFVSDYSFRQEESKPVFFDDNDFKDLNLIEEEKPIVKEKEERPLYGIKKTVEKEPEEKKIFKPTPIISPVYGVLNKNYHKEDIVSRDDVVTEKVSLEPSIDSIRDKAYGTLEDELENTLFGSNSILFKREEKKETEEEKNDEFSDDILSDLTDDIGKELDELLIKKEKYISDEDDDIKDNNLKEKNDEDTAIDNIDDEDLLGFIDSTLYKEGEDNYDD